MKASAEIFRGIEFIRISNLPEDQKEFIKTSVSNDKIIKILKDKIVIKDCIQYQDYLALYNQYASVRQFANQHKPIISQKREANYKLAFK